MCELTRTDDNAHMPLTRRNPKKHEVAEANIGGINNRSRFSLVFSRTRDTQTETVTID